jgi:hypothetical protein
MTIAEALDRALRRANIPIVGVKVGDESNRATWIVLYTDNASPADRANGAAIVASYDPATDAALKDEDADARIDADKALKAIVLWQAQLHNLTPLQARNQLRAIYRTL